MKRGLAALGSFFFILLVPIITTAQDKGKWSQISLSALRQDKSNLLKKVDQVSARAFHLEEKSFRNNLKNVASYPATELDHPSSYVEVPNISGEIKNYKIVEASVMQPALALKHPEIKTYVGQGVEDPSAIIHFDISPTGFHAVIQSPTQKTIFVDPVDQSSGQYIVYNKDADSNNIFNCITSVEENGIQTSLTTKNADDNKLRIYRLALAVNGEFSQAALDGSESNDAERKAKVLAVLVTDITRVDAIYERDFGVRMQLVGGEENIIFLDPEKDPFSNRNNWNEEVQHAIDSIIGNDNYDLGHLLAKVSSPSDNDGDAGCIACVCKEGSKGSGYTAHTDIAGNSMVVDYLAHEMGHQFGATHTFSFQNEGTDTQMEPGSGSTIMGYAGITGNNDVQSHSDDYFHAISIEQITDYIKSPSGGGKCAEIEISDNHPPTADAGKDYIIPKSTPFVLKGAGSDEDADDVLTYCWEQFDNFVRNKSNSIPSATSTTGPAFRSMPYSTSNERTFPTLTTILSGKTATKWEALPSVQRNLTFRLTVRDNHAGDGNNMSDDMTVTVDSTSGPFVITNLDNNSVWGAGDFKDIKWNVANTNNEIVNCQFVNIELSLDGGHTFPIMLASNTANDGDEFVEVPQLPTTKGRIRISAVNNIFFDISNKDISLTASLPIRWLSFSAVKNNNNINLDWSVSNETNAALYAVQRSTDGIHFTTIGYVDPGKNAYTFVDHIPFPDTNYYRLKQVDEDGTYRYSKIEMIRNGNVVPSWIIYPNPAKDFATIKLYNDLTDVQIGVYSASGLNVYQQKISKGFSGNEIRIPVDHLSQGVYFFKLQSREGSKTEKLFINK